MGMNVIILTGRLAADPEMRVTKTGKNFVKATIAVGRTFKKDETDFINLVAWDKKAELIGQYLKKGNMLGVTGSLRTRTYETEDGQKRKVSEVLVETLEFLESKKSNSDSDFEDISLDLDAKDSDDDSEFPF